MVRGSEYVLFLEFSTKNIGTVWTQTVIHFPRGFHSYATGRLRSGDATRAQQPFAEINLEPGKLFVACALQVALSIWVVFEQYNLRHLGDEMNL